MGILDSKFEPRPIFNTVSHLVGGVPGLDHGVSGGDEESLHLRPRSLTHCPGLYAG